MAGKKPYKDMTGRQFGRLKVIRRDGTYKNTRQALWLCRCDCGNTARVPGNSLRRGLSQSCGCLKGGVVRHGRAGDPIHNIWLSMRQRCSNPSGAAYGRYGGRGIRVCKRWQVFENFLKDMGERPSPDMTIERINNDGNYCPSNCRWASRQDQANNTRRNKWLNTTDGPMTVAQAARRVGIRYGAMVHRIKAGWPDKDLLLPKRQGRRASTT